MYGPAGRWAGGGHERTDVCRRIYTYKRMYTMYTYMDVYC